MSDLVERLRDEFGGTSSATYNLMREAARRIEALEAALRGWQRAGDIAANEVNCLRTRMDALEAALRAIEDVSRAIEDVSLDRDHEAATMAITTLVRAALAPEQDR